MAPTTIDVHYYPGQPIDVAAVTPGVRVTVEEKLIYAVECEQPPGRWLGRHITQLLTTMTQIAGRHQVGATFAFERQATDRGVVLTLRLGAAEKGPRISTAEPLPIPPAVFNKWARLNLRQPGDEQLADAAGSSSSIFTLTAADALIAEINRLADEGAEVDVFKDPIHKLVSIMKLAIGTVLEPGTLLYRATKHHQDVPSRLAEIAYPPADKIRTLGRCNRIGQSLFYCSSDVNAVLFEINPSASDLVVRATWKVTKRLAFQDLGYSPSAFDRLGASRQVPTRYQDFEERLDDDALRIRRFLADAFTEPTSRMYSLTVAMAENHLNCEDIAGVIYPAITRSADCDNLALLPKIVDHSLELVHAEALRVRRWNSTDPDAYGIADLQSVQPDGLLVWRYDGPEPIACGPGEPRALWLKPGETLTSQSDSEIEFSGRRYSLKPGFTIELRGTEIVVKDNTGRII